MQGYARAMLPKDICTNCKYYGVNELDDETVPQPLRANLYDLRMAMQNEKKGVMNSNLKGQHANAMMQMRWPMKMGRGHSGEFGWLTVGSERQKRENVLNSDMKGESYNENALANEKGPRHFG